MQPADYADGPVANSLLFADVKGYSSLRGKQVEIFLNEVIGKMALVFQKHKPIYSNTWGDAVFAIYATPSSAAYCGLDLCHLFRHEILDYRAVLGELAIRVSLHFGQFHRGTNAITGRPDYVGANVNLAARIEPIVGPNQVWATERFKNALEPEFTEHIAVQRIGVRELVKGFGTQELFRISHDPVSELELKIGSYWNDPQFKVRGIHHINLPVSNLQYSLEFYKKELGLREATDSEIMDSKKERLPFNFSGAWLYLPDGRQIHLIANQPEDTPIVFNKDKAINFKDVHFAFMVNDYEAMEERFRKRKTEHPYMPGPMACQFYTTDPDGHVIEITGPDGPQCRVVQGP